MEKQFVTGMIINEGVGSMGIPGKTKWGLSRWRGKASSMRNISGGKDKKILGQAPKLHRGILSQKTINK